MNLTIRRLMYLGLLGVLLCGGHAVANDRPLKIFVLAGQSNMQGHAKVTTFDHIGMDPKTAPLLKEMRNADGSPVVCEDVWISSIGSADTEQVGKLTAGFGAKAGGPKIGPEFTFGIFMQKALNEPILIIKTAWGGKSLHTDYRSPSAGPYEFNTTQLERFRKQKKDIDAIKADRAKATGHYYRLMTAHVQKVLGNIKAVYPDYNSDQGFELAGFVWFQGWNDMVDSGVYPQRGKPGGYDQYSHAMAHFIRDVRKDLNAPKLPFVIGVMGAGGPVSKYLPEQKRYSAIHQGFRDAMAAPASLPEFKGNVVTVLTENYWDLELTALRARDAKVRQQVKKLQNDGQLQRKDASAKQQQLRNDEFTERELEVLQKGVSNAEYHYLGCAKIFAQIGKGFAEAMIDVRKGMQR